MSVKLAIWREEYETGNALVDAQHQHLFDLLNELHDAMLQGRGREVIAETIDELIAYTVEHFQTEEGLMAERGYPHLEAHREIHERLTREVQEFAREIGGDRPEFQKSATTIQLSRFLTRWLIDHIKEEDLAMVAWVKNAGVGEAGTLAKRSPPLGFRSRE